MLNKEICISCLSHKKHNDMWGDPDNSVWSTGIVLCPIILCKTRDNGDDE